MVLTNVAGTCTKFKDEEVKLLSTLIGVLPRKTTEKSLGTNKKEHCFSK